jgi:hypothetical protein
MARNAHYMLLELTSPAPTKYLHMPIYVPFNANAYAADTPPWPNDPQLLVLQSH